MSNKALKKVRIQGSMKDKIVASELLEERARCNID
jgi:hypothetical protein